VHRSQNQIGWRPPGWQAEALPDDHWLPEHAGDILMEALVDLYWLKIGIQIDDEPTLMRLIESKLM